MRFCCELSLVHAVDHGSAAKGVARIKRGPEVVDQGIADVSFDCGQRLLSENFGPVIGSVVREEVSAGVGIELPLLLSPEWVRNGNFRFEGPPV
jgi:hypothetical protein